MKRKSIYFLYAIVIFLTLYSCSASNSKQEVLTLTAEERAAGLSLIWKEAQNNFPFWINLKDLDWDAAYYETLTNILEMNDTRKYYLELSKFITLLRDGHTGIISFPEIIMKNAGKFPVWFEYINGKHYIADYDVNMDIDLYSEVIKINKIDVNDYLSENLYPYFWHEKLDSSYWQVNWFLPLVEYGKQLEITTEKRIIKVKATTGKINWKGTAPMLRDEQLTGLFESKGLKVELTNDNIAVITIPTFSYSGLQYEFYGVLPKIENCNGFIIDVRNNGGGNSGYADSVAQAFIKDKKFANSRERIKVYDIITNNQYYEDIISYALTYNCPVYLDQPLVVLVNQGTASAAEDFLVVLDNIKRATIVGTASYGSTGQPVVYDLPGGGEFRICTRWCLYPNGKEFINIGVEPDIYAAFSIDDLKNRHDSVFTKGINVLREKIKRSDN